MTREEQELRQAIRQKCLDCCGGMRKEVERCRITACPLHEYRTGEAKTRAQEPPGRQISIDQYLRRAAI